MVQVILQNGGRGYRIKLAAPADAAQVASLCAHDGLGFARREPLVPHRDRDAHDPLSDTGEVAGAAGLRALGPVRVQRQADDHVAHVFTANQLPYGIEDRCKTLRSSIKNGHGARQQTQLVAHGHANPPLARVDAQHAAWRLIWVPER